MQIEDLPKNLDACLDRVKAGDTVFLLDKDTPIAELRPLPAPLPTTRPYGRCAGHFVVPDDFDAPLPEDLLSEFESP